MAQQYKKKFRENPDDPRHGSLNGYDNLDCRCDRCKAAAKVRRKKQYDAWLRHRARMKKT